MVLKLRFESRVRYFIGKRTARDETESDEVGLEAIILTLIL